eukprot:CAMPEP_0171789740 /NCGR_PEP_ID=MMETSP0991-20121206/65297_1 /TAXON_ID=483369 /ORGANISM="non described non described, Strain CCMP2098" /LENGTH=289 /DNA_ID=CAMNT_0012399183 /DNA_START=49 /DNA_END=915 /DNA_ORIENTATION=+
MTLVLLVLVACLSMLQNSVAASLDESLQTAQDYSVIVDDPQEEDSDPQEWADFFSQFGHVTFVTVAKDNGPLIKAMAQRRAVMREIVMMIGNGEASVEEGEDGWSMDTTWGGKSFKTKISEPAEASDQSQDHKSKTRQLLTNTKLFGMKPLADWKKALGEANQELQHALTMGSGKFKPSKVFVTFETEVGQRRCLKALTQGSVTAAFDLNRDLIPARHVWKGTNVLAVQEAPEPAAVFWEDVQVTFVMRWKQQSFTLGEANQELQHALTMGSGKFKPSKVFVTFETEVG